MSTSTEAQIQTSTERLRHAIRERESTDYIFHFWPAFGWTILTFGLFSFYIFYQLIRRSRDHNRRQADLLLAAHDIAWERAVADGKSESLRPVFEHIRADIQSLRSMTSQFRDPTLWLLFSIVGGGLVWLAGALLLDQDLIRHQTHERSAEDKLRQVFGELGVALPVSVVEVKGAHNYVGRIIAVVVSLSLYSLWWVADLMREGNANFQAGYAWEDALAQSAGA